MSTMNLTNLLTVPTRAQQEAQWEALWGDAVGAANAAVAPFDVQDWRRYATSYLIIRPATSRFVRYLRRNGIGARAMTGGGWIVGFRSGDSEMCLAYNDAMRRVLVGAGVRVDSIWWLD